MATQTKLTTLEKSVMRALLDSSYGNGHDFGIVEEARSAEGLKTARSLAGVMASLSKKGIVQIYGYEPGVQCTQFEFTAIRDFRNSAKTAGMPGEEYSEKFHAVLEQLFALCDYPRPEEVNDSFDPADPGPALRA